MLDGCIIPRTGVDHKGAQPPDLLAAVGARSTIIGYIHIFGSPFVCGTASPIANRPPAGIAGAAAAAAACKFRAASREQ